MDQSASTAATPERSGAAPGVTHEWCARHFDFASPKLHAGLDDALKPMRAECPIRHSDARRGYWSQILGSELDLRVDQLRER